MRTWGGRALLPILLASCSGQLVIAPAPPPTSLPMPHHAAIAPAPPRLCRLVMAARIDLLPDPAAKPVIRVIAGGTSLRLWVDSGAETSLLTQDGADRLGIAANAGSRRIAGFGGQQSYRLAALPPLSFGGQALPGLRWPVMALRGAGIDGLIGADLLAPYQVSIDFPAHRLTLYRAYGCADPAPPWPATPLAWQTPLPLPIVPATLDGKPTTALIDTGAHWSVVDQAAAGLTATDLAQDKPVQSFGAGGLAFAARIHSFASLSLGSVTLAAPTLRATNLVAAMPARLVIGDDLLARHRLWLDYAGRRAFVGW